MYVGLVKSRVICAWVGLNIVYFSLQKHVLAFNQLTGKIFLSEMIRLYFIVH